MRRRVNEGDDGVTRVTLYHNPRCSKPRQALELVREKNIDPGFIEYLRTPPSVAEVL